ncbi:hypothetical protein ACXYTJ_10265 [Gilvimarinus sp. F26214L]|uniref:hypothetical protein n=1 Tax=Gilvimarinus sp. DZF01 TaxID=3461371 RepID=UPI004045689F
MQPRHDDEDSAFAKQEIAVFRNLLKGLGLTFAIFVGVTAGNLASNYIMVRSAALALERETEKLSLETQERIKRSRERTAQQQRAAAERREQQEKDRAERLQRQRAAAARKAQLNSTCDFWIAEYRKSRSSYDQAQRDVACRAAGRPFN